MIGAMAEPSPSQQGLPPQPPVERSDVTGLGSELNAVGPSMSSITSATGHQSGSNTAASNANIAAITRIGNLLDRVNELAQSARQSFFDGQHAHSSMCLGDLQRSVTEIGELGTRSLALMNESHQLGNKSETQEVLGHRRTATESSLKKRPANDTEIDFSPFKTLRSQDGTPINPPPSAPPAIFDGSSNGMAGSVAPASAPIPSPSAPPMFSATSSTPAGIAPVPSPAPIQRGSSLAQPAPVFTGQTPMPQQMHHRSPVTPQNGLGFYPPPASHPSALAQSTPSTPVHDHRKGSSGQRSQSSSRGESIFGDVPPPQSNSLHMAFPSHHQQAQGHLHQSGPPSPQESWSNTDSSFESFYGRENAQQRRGHSRGRTNGGGASSSSNSYEAYPSQDEMPESTLLPSERGMSGANVSPELKAKLHAIFFEFLEKVCSDIDYCDSKGEHLHQILTAKKMSRGSLASTFKAFKFRIQAFTNAFHEEVVSRLGEHECNPKQSRAFLWASSYIARFNESGVKEKSKGNHVWRVEARKNALGRFEFREFKTKIMAPSQVAYHGMEWRWPLRIWDPQAPSNSIKAVFDTPNLPKWILREEGPEKQTVLFGTPDSSCQSTQLYVTAHYVARGSQHLVRLSATVDLQVAPLLDPPPSAEVPAAEPDVNMEEVEIEQAESVIAPSQVAQVMSQINFPFTPPASLSTRNQYFGNEQVGPPKSDHVSGHIGQGAVKPEENSSHALHSQGQAPCQVQPQTPSHLQPHEQIQANQIRELMLKQEEAAATMRLNMPPLRRKSDFPSQPSTSSTPQMQNHISTQQQAMASSSQVPPTEATFPQQQQQKQEQQQKQQQQNQPHLQQQQRVAQMGPAHQMAPVAMSQAPTSHANVHHPGLTLTPMSSLPQMAATLPSAQAHTHTHMTAGSNDPMLSPALPIGFDPIAHEGARIQQLQQQQAQHQTLQSLQKPGEQQQNQQE